MCGSGSRPSSSETAEAGGRRPAPAARAARPTGRVPPTRSHLALAGGGGRRSSLSCSARCGRSTAVTRTRSSTHRGARAGGRARQPARSTRVLRRRRWHRAGDGGRAARRHRLPHEHQAARARRRPHLPALGCRRPRHDLARRDGTRPEGRRVPRRALALRARDHQRARGWRACRATKHRPRSAIFAPDARRSPRRVPSGDASRAEPQRARRSPPRSERNSACQSTTRDCATCSSSHKTSTPTRCRVADVELDELVELGHDDRRNGDVADAPVPMPQRRDALLGGLPKTGVLAGAGLGTAMVALLASPAFADKTMDVQMLQTAASIENLAVATYDDRADARLHRWRVRERGRQGVRRDDARRSTRSTPRRSTPRRPGSEGRRRTNPTPCCSTS